MKTLNDIKQDMSTLYDQLRDSAIDLKLASELANIAGKNLKAEQLSLARDIFLSGQYVLPSQSPVVTIEHATQ